jgi:hypothetical protein
MSIKESGYRSQLPGTAANYLVVKEGMNKTRKNGISHRKGELKK